jgi:acetyl-CoA carboxylase alpha subunit
MKRPKTIDDILGGWFAELERDGTAAKWKLEKKVKETERYLRKRSRILREQRIIDEVIEEMSAQSPVGA